MTACCCLLLAGKVEETPKKCKDIIRTAKTLVSEQKFMTFGEDPKVSCLVDIDKIFYLINKYLYAILCLTGRSFDIRKNFTTNY